MKKVAWVDHSFHKKTKSSQFVIDLLLDHGCDIDFYWDETWRGGNCIDISNLKSYNCIVLWQSLNNYNPKFAKIHSNITLVPMLDCYGITLGKPQKCDYWRSLSGVKVLNFSRIFHYFCQANELESGYFQYFLPPKEKHTIDGLHGFFWCRRPQDISWYHIRKLISRYKFDSFHLHLVADDSEQMQIFPSDIDVKNHNITISSSWFENKHDLERIMAKANIFFAPRLEEGIGMAMLEALACGKCIVSPNNGTMNEYIQNGFNGILYNTNALLPLNFNNVQAIFDAAYNTAIAGYSQWLNVKDLLAEYILSPIRVIKHHTFFNSLSILAALRKRAGQRH